MKRISAIALKASLIVVLLTGGSLLVNSKTGDFAQHAMAGTLTEYDVTYYLRSLGYEVYYVKPAGDGTENWLASTSLNGVYYNTTVYVKDNQIISHEDVAV